MVLREFDLDKRILRFHTDNRAAKIKVINESNLASVVGYDPDLKVQIKNKLNKIQSNTTNTQPNATNCN